MVMSLRAVFLILIFVLLAVFTALNWSAFIAPTTLSLLFATVQAPIGLIMLVVTALLAGLFLLYLAYIQSAVILDTRRSARELAAQRDLADQAEASRFTELRAYLEGRLQEIERAVTEAQARTGGRVDQIETELRAAMGRTENTLSAYIGELGDRLDRRVGEAGAKPST
jgi:uncharacterized integral membrane protein